MCAGSVYFDTYCGPLLASFERAYGGSAAEHRVVVFFASVDKRILEAARERFSPWAHFQELPRGGLTGEGDEHFNSSTSGDSNAMRCELGEDSVVACDHLQESVGKRAKKVEQNNLWFPFHVEAYLNSHEMDSFCYVVLMDSDMLFVRALGEFLPDCGAAAPDGEEPWDVAITTYDAQFVVPWADDPAEVGRTRSGFSRINAGIVLVSLRHFMRAVSFLHRWAQATTWMHSGGGEALGIVWEGEYKQQWELWREELLDEFRGPNQAGLALLLCSYQTDQLPQLLGWDADCRLCREPVEARLDLFEGEEPTVSVFRALPARLLNHAESMPDGRFSSDLLLIHLKGLWWRTVLPTSAAFFIDDHRTSTWNRETLALFWLLYDTWHFALPPEAWPSQDKNFEDGEGNPVSEQQLREVLKMQFAERDGQ